MNDSWSVKCFRGNYFPQKNKVEYRLFPSGHGPTLGPERPRFREERTGDSGRDVLGSCRWNRCRQRSQPFQEVNVSGKGMESSSRTFVSESFPFLPPSRSVVPSQVKDKRKIFREGSPPSKRIPKKKKKEKFDNYGRRFGVRLLFLSNMGPYYRR